MYLQTTLWYCAVAGATTCGMKGILQWHCAKNSDVSDVTAGPSCLLVRQCRVSLYYITLPLLLEHLQTPLDGWEAHSVLSLYTATAMCHYSEHHYCVVVCAMLTDPLAGREARGVWASD